MKRLLQIPVVAGSFDGTVMGILFHNPVLSLRVNVYEFESLEWLKRAIG